MLGLAGWTATALIFFPPYFCVQVFPPSSLRQAPMLPLYSVAATQMTREAGATGDRGPKAKSPKVPLVSEVGHQVLPAFVLLNTPAR